MDPITIGKQIKQAYPQYANVDETTLGTKYLQKYGGAVQGVQSGKIKLSDIPEAQRVGVSLGLSGPAALSTEDKKKAESFNAINNFITNLEGHYNESGGGSFGEGPGARIKGLKTSVAAMLGLNESANVFNREKRGFAATLKTLTGDTGVLTEQDFQRLSGLVPDLGSTPKEAKSLFNDLRSQLSSKFGGQKTETTFQPKSINTQGAGLNLLSAILPATGKAVESYQQTPPNILETLLGGAPPPIAAISQKYRENIPQAGLELLSTLGLAQGAKNLAGNIVGGTAKKIAAREIASKGVEVQTKSLVEAGENYVKTIDPAAQKAWDTLKPAIKDTTSLPELLQKITNWGDKSFTKSGDKRAITEGLLKAHLYKIGRNIINEQAPEVGKLTTDIARRIALGNTIGKLGPSIIGGAGATTGAGLMGYLLGRRQ